jgi:hypothetical protein
MEQELRRLAEQYQFFHWHLAFPDVFRLPNEHEELPDDVKEDGSNNEASGRDDER